jgi:hypothetical protein
LGSVCETRKGNPHHGTRIIALASGRSIADYPSGLVVRRAARLIFTSVRSMAQKMQRFPSMTPKKDCYV